MIPYSSRKDGMRLDHGKQHACPEFGAYRTFLLCLCGAVWVYGAGMVLIVALGRACGDSIEDQG